MMLSVKNNKKNLKCNILIAYCTNMDAE